MANVVVTSCYVRQIRGSYVQLELTHKGMQ